MPAAFIGAWVISRPARGEELDGSLKTLLGLALLLARGRARGPGAVPDVAERACRSARARPGRRARRSVVRPIPTIILGAVAGFIVGITSVGSGSIIIVALLLIYPGLKASSLVGTDLTQAIPLVGAAALGPPAVRELLAGRSRRRSCSARSPARSSAPRSPAARRGLVIRRASRSCCSRPGCDSSAVDRDGALIAAAAARIVVRDRDRRRAAAACGGEPPRASAGCARQSGAVVFMTGLSGAGKSTIAEALAALHADGREVTILDGDVLAEACRPTSASTAASREARPPGRRAGGEVAADGQIVIAALIAPFDRSRREARDIVAPVAPFLLDVDPDAARGRRGARPEGPLQAGPRGRDR